MPLTHRPEPRRFVYNSDIGPFWATNPLKRKDLKRKDFWCGLFYFITGAAFESGSLFHRQFDAFGPQSPLRIGLLDVLSGGLLLLADIISTFTISVVPRFPLPLAILYYILCSPIYTVAFVLNFVVRYVLGFVLSLILMPFLFDLFDRRQHIEQSRFDNISTLSEEERPYAQIQQFIDIQNCPQNLSDSDKALLWQSNLQALIAGCLTLDGKAKLEAAIEQLIRKRHREYQQTTLLPPFLLGIKEHIREYVKLCYTADQFIADSGDVDSWIWARTQRHPCAAFHLALEIVQWSETDPQHEPNFALHRFHASGFLAHGDMRLSTLDTDTHHTLDLSDPQQIQLLQDLIHFNIGNLRDYLVEQNHLQKIKAFLTTRQKCLASQPRATPLQRLDTTREDMRDDSLLAQQLGELIPRDLVPSDVINVIASFGCRPARSDHISALPSARTPLFG